MRLKSEERGLVVAEDEDEDEDKNTSTVSSYITSGCSASADTL